MPGRPAAPRLMALDLEMNQPSGRIVQIGAAIGDLASGAVLGTFEQLVNPGEPLAQHIRDLCALATDQVAAAPCIEAGVDALMAWRETFAPLEPNPLTWGGDDLTALRQELERAGGRLGTEEHAWPLGRRGMDAKTVFVAWRLAHGQSPQAGLARAMTKLGIAFVGRKHNATADAVNTFRVYHRLLQQFSGR